MNRMQVLKEAYEMATHNLKCYSSNILMTRPKNGYEKQWNEENMKVNLLQEMMLEEKQKERENMSNETIDLEFWVRDYIKRFNLDREGKLILEAFASSSKRQAVAFIKNQYESEVYRGDIIDTYCDKYDNVKINILLQDFDYDPLTEEEIVDYGIKVREEELEGGF